MPLYAELHAHSNFSFLEGASHIEELVLRARELGYEALALTDRDGLHGAMSRKRSREAIARLKQQFIEGCLQNGASPETAEAVFAKIAGFAEFGFPKAHAAAFGLLAYQTAWLRTYYPAESLCALFNAQPMGFYGPHLLVNDGKRHGVDVLPPISTAAGLTAPWRRAVRRLAVAPACGRSRASCRSLPACVPLCRTRGRRGRTSGSSQMTPF
ncbi:MAG: PHP domain-containing protein [Dehalococcoidia bacterium]|nr:PHP domain-containing protein [Dehalococcoidia bacterium]